MHWNEIGKDIEQSCLAGACSPRYEDVLPVDDRRLQNPGEFFRDCANANQVCDAEVLCIELADRECYAMQAARWHDSGDPTAVRQTRVEDRLFFRDVVPQSACDVPDGNFKGLWAEGQTRHRLDAPGALDEYGLRPIHHDLADLRVKDQVLDRTQEWQDQLKASRSH